MRKGLPLLLRLAQQETDEKQGDLSQVARASAEAAKALETHDAAAADEAQRALCEPDALMAMATWLPHAARNRAPLQHRATELDRRQDTAREALREAIARRKRLELALEGIQAEHQRQSARRVEQQADEHERARAVRAESGE